MHPTAKSIDESAPGGACATTLLDTSGPSSDATSESETTIRVLAALVPLLRRMAEKQPPTGGD